MKHKLKTGEVRDILDQLDREEISYSRMVELLNEKMNSKCKDMVINAFESGEINAEARHNSNINMWGSGEQYYKDNYESNRNIHKSKE